MRHLFYRASLMAIASAGLNSGLGAQIITEPRPTTTSLEIMSNGPAPYASTVTITGTPTVANVSWQIVSGATRYTVTRAKDGDAACCNAQSGEITYPALNRAAWVDNNNGTGIQWPGTYSYTITAWQADGHYGQTTVKWTRPEPANPTGFAAKQTGEGAAELSWQAVPNASYYRVWGPGAPTEGMRVNGTRANLTGVGTGAKEWSVTTLYDPAGVLLPQSSWPKAQLNMVSMTGMYRITLNGFQVVSPTKETTVTFDGAGNEVFAVAYVRAYDRTTGAVIREGSVESAVHGDTEGFAGRVPAGTAKPTGGLVAGDKFPGATPWARPSNSVSSTTFPLLLWEGPLTDAKDVVVVTPMIWEWTGTATDFNRYQVDLLNTDQRENSANLWATVSAALAGAGSWTGPTQIQLSWKGSGNAIAGGSSSQPLVDLFFREENRIRPIGADTPFSGDKKLYIVRNSGVVFTRELVEKALSATTQIGGMGPGVIEVKWIEKYPSSNGSYTLYLQVARQ